MMCLTRALTCEGCNMKYCNLDEGIHRCNIRPLIKCKTCKKVYGRGYKAQHKCQHFEDDDEEEEDVKKVDEEDSDEDEENDVDDAEDDGIRVFTYEGDEKRLSV